MQARSTTFSRTILATLTSLAVGTGLSQGAIYVTSLGTTDSVVGAAQGGYGPGTGYETNTSAASTIGEMGSTQLSTRVIRVSILGLNLPTFGAGETLVGAQLSFDITEMRRDKPELGSLDTYLLDSGDPSGSGTSLFYQSATQQTTAGGIDLEYLGRTPYNSSFSSPQAVSYSLGGDALALLQSFYTGNTPNQTEAFLRFNQTGSITLGSSIDRYKIDSGSVELTLTTIPGNVSAIPETSGLLVGALLSLALVRRRRP